MKKIKQLFFVLALSLFFGCSSDSETETPYQQTLNLSVNGVVNEGFNFYAVRYEDDIIIHATGYQPFDISFDAAGHLGNIKLELGVGSGNEQISRNYYTHTDFNSQYFDFNLISIDPLTNRIKGNFSGILYADPFDLNSEGKYVSGDFEMNYIDMAPGVTGLKNKAKINGNNWSRTSSYFIKDIPNDNTFITQNNRSDDAYKIMIKFKPSEIAIGTYNYTPLDNTNLVQVARFDPVTETYINYDCSGTLTITGKEMALSYTPIIFVLSGNYNFTAVNPLDPTDIIYVTEGVFKINCYRSLNP